MNLIDIKDPRRSDKTVSISKIGVAYINKKLFNTLKKSIYLKSALDEEDNRKHFVLIPSDEDSESLIVKAIKKNLNVFISVGKLLTAVNINYKMNAPISLEVEILDKEKGIVKFIYNG